MDSKGRALPEDCNEDFCRGSTLVADFATAKEFLSNERLNRVDNRLFTVSWSVKSVTAADLDNLVSFKAGCIELARIADDTVGTTIPAVENEFVAAINDTGG